MMPKQTTPKKLTAPLYKLIRHLGLDPKTAVWLPLTVENQFTPETINCLINTMVKRKLAGGDIVFGWVLWFERKANFAEAEFHCVWRAKDGILVDITPRVDGEEAVCFVSDPTRTSHLDLTRYPAVTHTYDNVRMRGGQLMNGVSGVIDKVS